MESLRKLKDSFMHFGSQSDKDSGRLLIYVIKQLRDVAKDIPNDERLGAEMRKAINVGIKANKL